MSHGLDKLRRDAVHEFRSRWGNLEHTVDIQAWQDGDAQVEVYHTIDTEVSDILVRRLSTLLEPDGSVEHREYIWRPGYFAGDPYTFD